MTDPEPSESGDKRDLLQAFDRVVGRELEKVVESASRPLPRRTGLAVAVLCVFAWGALAYTWIAKPAWLFPQDPFANMTAADQERELRFAIYLERERVLEYRARNGRLPATLADAGDVEAGVDYVITGDSTFVVSGGIGATELRLNEREPADALLAPTGIQPSRERP